MEQVEQITGFTRFGAYLTLLFEYDALILNDDRHLNNIAVLYTPTGYRYCPLFDHGAGFLLDPEAYAFDIETNALITTLHSIMLCYAIVSCMYFIGNGKCLSSNLLYCIQKMNLYFSRGQNVLPVLLIIIFF